MRQVAKLDVVLQGDPPYASSQVEIGSDSPSDACIAVNEVQIDGEKGSLRPVTAKRGPDAVPFDAPRAVVRIDPAEERTVEATVENVGRAALKETIRNPTTPREQRAAAVSALQRLPRDSSPVRLRNRDAVDGRPRGHLRKFGLSRVRVRELAHRGELPGVRKSSW